MNSPDGEKCLNTKVIEFYQEVSVTEDRYTVFLQESSTDKNITQQKFSFKLNTCKMREGPIRENTLIQMIRKDDQSLDTKCPYLAGLKLSLFNQSYDDSLLPPIPNEVYARLHKEVFGKLKGARKWLKLFTQDSFFRVKK
jgi:hypothetical protein